MLLALSGCSNGNDVDFDETAVAPTIEIVRPADKSRFTVAAPIEAEFRLDGGRGMKPHIFIISLKRGDMIATQSAVTPGDPGSGAETSYRTTFEKGLSAPGKYRLVVQCDLRPEKFRASPAFKRRPIRKIESAVDIEVTR